MEIEDYKKRKTRLLRGALNLQGFQVLFLGNVLDRIASVFHFSNPEKYKQKLIKGAHKAGYETLDAEDSLTKTSQAIAERSGIRLLHVFIKKNPLMTNASVTYVDDMAAIYFEGDPRQIPVHGESITEFIIGHELTHAKRKCDSHRLSLAFNWIFVTLSMPYHIVAAAITKTPLAHAGLLAAVFSVAAGFPAVFMMLKRNEEYLADIGSVHLTGNPAGALLATQYLEEINKENLKIGRVKLMLCNPYGLTHPSLGSRRDVLCEVFNVSAADRLQAEEAGTQLAQVMMMGPPCPQALRERRVG